MELARKLRMRGYDEQSVQSVVSELAREGLQNDGKERGSRSLNREPADVRKCALELLARREHSAVELARKLRVRGYDEQSVQSVVSELAREGLQNDGRFAENYVHHRLERGFGPLRITLELRERGMGDDLIDLHLDRSAQDWVQRAALARQKRFGARLPATFKDQARQSRFLQQRGFSGDQIRQIFKTGDE